MSRQLLNHHALICGIFASTGFKEYKGGILETTTVVPSVNHWVEIVGEGTEGGKKYWVGRNSWGTAWGISGFFKIKKGGDNLGI
jgi:cathepsin X